MKKLVWLVLILSVSVSFAENGNGSKAGAFQRIGIGARAKALGGTFTGIADDNTAIFYNPGGLAFLEQRQLTVYHNFMDADRFQNFLAYSQKLPPTASVGFAWLYSGTNKIDKRSSTGEHLGFASATNHEFIFSFANRFSEKFAAGINVKYILENLPLRSSNEDYAKDGTIALDASVTIKPIKNLTLGFLARDLKADFSWKVEDYERPTSADGNIPVSVRAGASYKFDWLVLAVDLEDYTSSDPFWHYGTEITWFDLVPFRLGMKDGTFTFGFGINYEITEKYKLQFDYAYDDENAGLRANQLFSVKILF
ncbi:PorV/PorQ family protein [bacterium]|nr:PorV/PorQ family protein [bacterium]